MNSTAKAIEIGATKVINIKAGRVGGLASAKRVHDVCASRDIPVWCGGMLEMGIGRAHNVHLASLPNFRVPGDVSAWLHIGEDGRISVFTGKPYSAKGTASPSAIATAMAADTPDQCNAVPGAHRVRRAGVHALRSNGWSRPSQACATTVALPENDWLH